jgi:HKD family nuclease
MQLIDNRRDEETLGERLRRLLPSAAEVPIHVACLRQSGVALVREALTELAGRGGRLRVLAGNEQIEDSVLIPLRHFDRGAADAIISRSEWVTPRAEAT